MLDKLGAPMTIKNFNIVLLLSICTIVTIHAMDDKTQHGTTQQYPFSDYDRNVFTNYETNKVELIYSTPFIESLSNDPITVTRWELDLLILPALTRIAFKQHDLMSRRCNAHNWLARTPEQKEEKVRYWKQEDTYSTQLAATRGTVEKLQTHIHDTNPNIAIPTREVMRMVQYAARKIIHHPLEQVCIVASAEMMSQQLVVHGEFAKLLTKYRAYEQQ
jgi:hypothetical protein